jgi:hypothetical protein
LYPLYLFYKDENVDLLRDRKMENIKKVLLNKLCRYLQQMIESSVLYTLLKIQFGGMIHYDISTLENINIPSNITSLNSTTVWPGGVTINTPTATGTMNSQGWIGPCPIFGSTGYDVTLVANLSNFTTLTSSVQFIVCTQVINGACYI